MKMRIAGSLIVVAAMIVLVGCPKPTDYFTEQFKGNFDLENTSLKFTPQDSVNKYSATQHPAAAFPTDPAGGAVLSFDIADPIEVQPWYGAQVSLYGKAYDKFFVSSKGFVMFGRAKNNSDNTLNEHFASPRVTGLGSLDAKAGGTVSVVQDSDRVTVTYENVPNAGGGGSNNLQLEMFENGTIRMTYLDMSAKSGVAGLSIGNGQVPDNYAESDLTSYNTGEMKSLF